MSTDCGTNLEQLLPHVTVIVDPLTELFSGKRRKLVPIGPNNKLWHL